MLPCLSLFSISQGVWQGVFFHPLNFDDLLQELADSGVGCHWDNLFVGVLAYADDLTILAPSPSVAKETVFYL